MIYFDHASTSFPKPGHVVDSIQKYLCNYGVSPGRGAYDLATRCETLVSETRGKLAHLINVEQDHIVFTNNATQSLNLVINGFAKRGDHILVCSYSHNSAMRPIEKLKQAGIVTYDVFYIDANGNVDLLDFQNKIKPNTRLVVFNHASNVIGVIGDFSRVVQICNKKGIRFLLDCTQSLGYTEIDLGKMPIDFLCGTGHKTLLGPSGVGFAYIKNPQEVDHVIVGGSGSGHSSSLTHPSHMPHKYEAGTLNTTAIAGLSGSLSYLEEHSFSSIREETMQLCRYAWSQLEQVEDIVMYGTNDWNKKVPIISFNLKGVLPAEAGYIYNSKGICLRIGLQCAPFVHKTLRTYPGGTIRISFGHFNQVEEINKFIEVTKEITIEMQDGKTCA